MRGLEKGKISYTYDRVFSPNSKQEDIFQELSPYLRNFLDGKHPLFLFSFGHRGTGKSFTLLGDPDNESYGLLGRTIDYALGLKEKGRLSTNISISAVEIHNEKIRDLIDGNYKENVF